MTGDFHKILHHCMFVYTTVIPVNPLRLEYIIFKIPTLHDHQFVLTERVPKYPHFSNSSSSLLMEVCLSASDNWRIRRAVTSTWKPSARSTLVRESANNYINVRMTHIYRKIYKRRALSIESVFKYFS